MEADLEETRSDFKLIVYYLRSTDKRFCHHNKDIAVSHESIASFLETVHLKEESFDKETTSEKPDKQNIMIEQDKDGFIPVINKRKKRNRRKNKKSKNRGILDNMFGNGKEDNTSEDSNSSTGTEGDGKTQHIPSDTDERGQIFTRPRHRHSL